MAIVRQHDKRSNTTYVYESTSWWDSELKMSRSRRRLIGKVDPETGEVVPTSGKMRRAAERKAAEAAAAEAAPDGPEAAVESLAAQVRALATQVDALSARLSALEGKAR